VKAPANMGPVPGDKKSDNKGIQAQADREISQQRKKIVDEAVSAIQDTKKALKSLEDKKTEEAIKALERATGKLNIILARDPQLALAPIDVAVVTRDVYGTLEQIKHVRKQAESYLEDGQLQKARHLIRELGSEIVISIHSLPLQTYPQAIVAVTPLIDQGKIAEAKEALQAALNTVVVTEHILPLPLVRAEEKLTKAEELAQKDARSEVDSKTLAKLIEESREQLKVAEALGYGTKQDYKKFDAEIEAIEEKTKEGRGAKGVFGTVRGYLSELKQTIFD
jgi:membrane-associated HD superfamily phosphohydrolase